MKKSQIFSLITGILLCHFLNAQLQPIVVAENTLKVAAFGEEVFYYGFAKGDQLIFDFSEEKGKELKEIEIIELPSSSKFMDYKTKKIENKVILINQTGIYKFRFNNSALGGRICKFKLQRIPESDATKDFNTSVFWRTVFDTTSTPVKEKYLIRKEYKPVSIIESSKHYINSGRNALFQGGKSRITLPINLPKNTTEWYYIFSASRDEASITKAKTSMNLVGQLTNLLDPTGASTIALNLLTTPPGADYCDIYLLDNNNRGPFEEKAEFKHYPEGSRENIMSGVVKIKSAILPNLFLGIKNPDSGVGIHVALEVVAITLEEEWGIRDSVKYDISSRQEAYLRN